MKKLVIAAALAAATFSGTAFAHEFKKGDLVIDQVWARATPPGAKTGAGYFTIVDEGKDGDRLIAAKSDIADRTEMHTHSTDGGVMKMHQVDGVDVMPGKPTKFEPGSYHVMFIGLKRQLKPGEQFPVTLVFQKAGEVSVTVMVADKASGGADGQKHGGHDGNMHDMKKAH